MSHSRADIIERLRSETFDIVVVGGGINGAAIARDATMRGYSVALIEKNDFAWGTSSKSSKLIHGGLRYLEKGEIGLVFESVSERHILSQVARHICRPLPFIFPVFGKSRNIRKSRFGLSIGLWMYDTLALFRNYKTHHSLNAAQLSDAVPGLLEEGLQGGVHYYDYQTNDARLVVENALDARERGAAVLTYAEVKSFDLTDTVEQTIDVECALTGETFTVRGHAIVSATGPWTDEITSMTGDDRRWLRPTKGIHIVVPQDRLPLTAAVALRHPRDRRVHFALPYFERTVVGTTDTDWSGDPDDVEANAEDVAYLLESANHFFPAARLVATDVIATWAGLRPLVNAGDADGPSDVSREHHIEVWEDGLVVIAGGKLTTYRRMAAECVDVAARLVHKAKGPRPKKAADTETIPLPGAEGLERDRDLDILIDKLAEQVDDREIAAHLATTYGTRAEAVASAIDADRSAGDRLIDELPFIWAEIDFVAAEEIVVTLTDILVRRLQILWRDRDQGLRIAEEAARRAGAVLGWDDAECALQVRLYREAVASNRAWRETFGRPTESARV